MSGASKADWSRWKVNCLELKGWKKRSLGWREDFEKVGGGGLASLYPTVLIPPRTSFASSSSGQISLLR